MNRFALAACAGLLATAFAVPATAADMPLPYKMQAAPAAPFNWTGFYVGINGGYAWGTSNWTGAGDFNATGAMAGGTVGYNLQMSQFVVGFEADFDGSWLKGSATSACCEIKNDWFGTARARLGVAMDRWMPFVTGGAAFGDVKLDTVLGSDTDTRIGWTAGAGVEYAFTGAWSAKLEYLYVDLGTPSCSVTTCGVATDVAFKTNIVRGGVNYHF
jgi:outer membrane immunogenic protein